MRIAAVVGVIAMLAVAATAQASGLGFMARGPMARFNSADMKLLNDAIEQARSAPEMGTPVDWANDKTGSSGSVTPVRVFEERGQTCRDLRVVNRHRQLESTGVFAMCQRKDGTWQWLQ
ncbi:MAG: RT0821/Lpp0805 family surface protein [Burkholderiaceae bacterium]|jgi:surface antigen|nr:RT0821/Lpp0805 family surface protein [Burkholderiaceae bacterium]